MDAIDSIVDSGYIANFNQIDLVSPSPPRSAHDRAGFEYKCDTQHPLTLPLHNNPQYSSPFFHLSERSTDEEINSFSLSELDRAHLYYLDKCDGPSKPPNPAHRSVRPLTDEGVNSFLLSELDRLARYDPDEYDGPSDAPNPAFNRADINSLLTLTFTQDRNYMTPHFSPDATREHRTMRSPFDHGSPSSNRDAADSFGNMFVHTPNWGTQLHPASHSRLPSQKPQSPPHLNPGTQPFFPNIRGHTALPPKKPQPTPCLLMPEGILNESSPDLGLGMYMQGQQSSTTAVAVPKINAANDDLNMGGAGVGVPGPKFHLVPATRASGNGADCNPNVPFQQTLATLINQAHWVHHPLIPSTPFPILFTGAELGSPALGSNTSPDLRTHSQSSSFPSQSLPGWQQQQLRAQRQAGQRSQQLQGQSQGQQHQQHTRSKNNSNTWRSYDHQEHQLLMQEQEQTPQEQWLLQWPLEQEQQQQQQMHQQSNSLSVSGGRGLYPDYQQQQQQEGQVVHPLHLLRLNPNVLSDALPPMRRSLFPGISGSASGRVGHFRQAFSDVEGDSFATLSVARDLNDLTGSINRDPVHPVHGGAYADVYTGILSQHGQKTKVAVKVIRAHTYTEDKRWKIDKRLKREIRLWSRLQHPNVIPLLGTTMDFGSYTAMVCPWMNEGNLSHYLHAQKAELNLGRRLQILADIVEGLSYRKFASSSRVDALNSALKVHAQPVIHGDLTSGNVLMNAGKAHLSDFGLSNVMAEVRSISFMSSTVAGSPRWAAPELFHFGADVNQASETTKQCDIYSLGSVALQVISGRGPWEDIVSDFRITMELVKGNNPPRPPEPLLSDELWNFIVPCWDHDPFQRPEIDVLRHRLEELRSGCKEEALAANVS